MVTFEKETEQDEKLDEETMFQMQSNFEEKLYEEVDSPNAIGRNSRYIFRFLMRPWFKKLSSENRYRDEMIQKVRQDWVDYMSAMEDRATLHYLSMESDGEKSEQYNKRSYVAFNKQSSIERAFASAVGGNATEQLEEAYEIEYEKLSKYGDPAPEGMEYGLEGEKLTPIKSKL